jgi:hypothetical protein
VGDLEGEAVYLRIVVKATQESLRAKSADSASIH